VGYFVRGLAFRDQGEYVKALVEAQKAIAYDPNYANAHVLLAVGQRCC
jgi:Tfp pilus assembly protein PilF